MPRKMTATLERVQEEPNEGIDYGYLPLSDDVPVREIDTDSTPSYDAQTYSVPSVTSLVQEQTLLMPSAPIVQTPALERPAVQRAEALLSTTGAATKPLQRLTMQMGILRDGGIFGDIDTEGANSLMMSVDLVEAGAWKTTERDAKKRLVERNPQVSVLPQYWVGKLRTPLANARAALNDHSYRFPVTDAFIGPSFRFIPWTQWDAFIADYRRAQDDLERVKEELLDPQTYQEAGDAVLQQAMQRAEHAAKALEANGTPVKDDFIPNFVQRVQGRIPTMSAIRSKLKISFTPGILGDESDLLDYETRLAEAIIARRVAQENSDAIAETKANMRLFVLEALKERLQSSLMPFEQMLQGFKAEAYRTLTSVRECLTTEQFLDRTQARKLEHLYGELSKIKEFLGDEFTEEKLDSLTASAAAFGAASARLQSPILAGQLETLLANMQAICRDAADEILVEDTGISAAV